MIFYAFIHLMMVMVECLDCLQSYFIYRSGYYVGRYISLEAKISKIKDLYYDALFESQKGWHEGNDDPTPFVKFLLSIIEMAYEDLVRIQFGFHWMICV